VVSDVLSETDTSEETYVSPEQLAAAVDHMTDLVLAADFD
jgi:hypothetical protein